MCGPDPEAVSENMAHVVPTNDLVAHSSDEDCPCGPDVHFVDGGKVVVHHSLDGRELKENPA